jgi:hypothetical protein
MQPLPRALLVLTLTLAAAGAQAQLRTLPLPGLWEQESRVLVNGQDMMAMVRQMQAEMMKKMTPEQRKQMQAQMGSTGLSGPIRECLTADEAKRFSDPKRVIEDMQKDSPNCRFQPATVTSDTVAFTGTCADPNGFTGTVKGDVHLVSDKVWTGRFSGQGRGPANAQMPGAAGPNNTAMTVQTEMKGRWLASQCGDVKPQAR